MGMEVRGSTLYVVSNQDAALFSFNLSNSSDNGSTFLYFDKDDNSTYSYWRDSDWIDVEFGFSDRAVDKVIIYISSQRNDKVFLLLFSLVSFWFLLCVIVEIITDDLFIRLNISMDKATIWEHFWRVDLMELLFQSLRI